MTQEKAKIVRTFDLVDVKEEVQPLLNLLANKAKIGDHTALQRIGYKNPGSTLSEMYRVGLVKRTLMYGLKGLIAELGLEDKAPAGTEFGLSYEEAELLFKVLGLARPAMPTKAQDLKALAARVASHMVKLMQ